LFQNNWCNWEIIKIWMRSCNIFHFVGFVFRPLKSNWNHNVVVKTIDLTLRILEAVESEHISSIFCQRIIKRGINFVSSNSYAISCLVSSLSIKYHACEFTFFSLDHTSPDIRREIHHNEVHFVVWAGGCEIDVKGLTSLTNLGISWSVGESCYRDHHIREIILGTGPVKIIEVNCFFWLGVCLFLIELHI